jgi:hypothetical protein
MAPAIASRRKADNNFRGVLRDPERGGGSAALIRLMEYAALYLT